MSMLLNVNPSKDKTRTDKISCLCQRACNNLTSTLQTLVSQYDESETNTSYETFSNMEERFRSLKKEEIEKGRL